MNAADDEVPGPDDRGPELADERQAARVGRLLLWYPRAWRIRYGEEFAELLAAELAEYGPSWRRNANVAATGLRARLAGAGLTGHPLDPAAAARAGLATVATSVAAAVLAGGAMWAQLATGLQWSVPKSDGVTRAMALMSGALLLLAALTILAAAPVAWAAIAAAVRGHGRSSLGPAVMIGFGITVLVIGGHHFENGWPGTGGHLLATQGSVPGGVAAFGWAATMWITSYWAHPAALGAFPAVQIAWMVLCPLAIGCVVTGAVQLLRRVRLSPRALRYESWLANIAGAGLAAFVGGAVVWVLSAGAAGPGAPFRIGAIDRAAVATLAVALLGCAAAARHVRAAAVHAAAAGRSTGPAQPARPRAPAR
ncbi:MAG: hypothetical protein ACTHKL_09550 [Streptosporangiaceae bacterium]